MKYIQKILLAIVLCFTQVNTQQNIVQQLSQEESTALRLIGAMQESVRQYQALQNQIKNNATITKINSLKMIFSQSLDQYLTMFGQVYEKQTGLLGGYQLAYHITSNKNQNEPITPNEYTILLNCLQQATQHSDWGKTINLELSVIKNGLINKKTLTVQEIINGIKQVPLPTNYYYSATNIVMGAAAIAALAIGAYIVSSATTQQPATALAAQQVTTPLSSVVTSKSSPVATTLPPAPQVLKSPAATPVIAPLAPQTTPAVAVASKIKPASPTFPTEKKMIAINVEDYKDLNKIKEMYNKKNNTNIQKKPKESYLLQGLNYINDAFDEPHKDDGRFSTHLIDSIGSAVEKASDMLPNIPINIAPEAQAAGKLVKNFTVGLYTHVAKTMMDLPGDIYNVTTQVTKNLINPSPELQEQNHQYQDFLEQMSPEDRLDYYENYRVGSIEADKKFAMATLAKGADLSFSGAFLKPLTKTLIGKTTPVLKKQLSTTTMENVSKIGEKIDTMTTVPIVTKLGLASIGMPMLDVIAQIPSTSQDQITTDQPAIDRDWSPKTILGGTAVGTAAVLAFPPTRRLAIKQLQKASGAAKAASGVTDGVKAFGTTSQKVPSF